MVEIFYGIRDFVQEFFHGLILTITNRMASGEAVGNSNLRTTRFRCLTCGFNDSAICRFRYSENDFLTMGSNTLRITFRFVIFVIASFVAVFLSGRQTAEGSGRDIQSLGQRIEESSSR